MKKRLFSLGVGLVTLLLALCLGEGFLRVIPTERFYRMTIPSGLPSWMVYDPIVSWKNFPGTQNESFTINSWSYRGPEIAPVAKGPEVKRILTLGDSGTFGFWIGNDTVHFDSYPEKLAQKISSSGYKNVELINAATLGYTSNHGLRSLLTRALTLQPDIVTVRFGFNENTRAFSGALRAQEPASSVARFILYNFYDWELFRLATAVYHRMKWFHPEPKAVVQTTQDEFRANLKRFAELSREKNFKLIFIDYPLRPESGPVLDKTEQGSLSAKDFKTMRDLQAAHAEYQSLMKAVAAEEQIPVVETESLLTTCRPSCFSPEDHVHPNARGMQVIADRLFDKLKEKHWLP